MLAGKSTAFAQTPFDLLCGTNVCYDSSAGAKMVTVKTNAIHDLVQFSTGCAIAAVLTAYSCRAISFPVTKNYAQWKPFAIENTVALQKWLEIKEYTSFAKTVRRRGSAATPSHNNNK